jgi:large subunit ribosomal protein L9
MKVILNKDLAPLGEEGDVRDVARGYARNYLFPRKIALPYTETTIKLFESRREEIEKRKGEKRKDALGLKEKLESLNLEITMSAGANGKLYGAVTSQTLADELAKQGHQIERKRIELAGTSFKSVGKYKVLIKLYESAAAEISVTVVGQEIKTETKSQVPPKGGRRRREAANAAATAEAAVPGEPAVPAGVQSETTAEVPASPEASASEEAVAETSVPEGSGETSPAEEFSSGEEARE